MSTDNTLNTSIGVFDELRDGVNSLIEATNLTQNAIWLVGLGNGTLQGERWHRVS